MHDEVGNEKGRAGLGVGREGRCGDGGGRAGVGMGEGGQVRGWVR